MNKKCINVILLCLFLPLSLKAQNTPKRNGETYKIMMISPDSSLSNEMLKTKYQLGYYFFSFTDVVGGKLVYKPDNTDENYKKFSKLYLDYILKNIDEINNYPDTTRNLIVNSFPEMKRDALAKLSEMVK